MIKNKNSCGAAFDNFFRKFFVYKGRASRSEVWWPILVIILPIFVLNKITNPTDHGTLLVNILVVAKFIASAGLISVSVRRFHDVNLSGWWLALFPVSFLLFVMVKNVPYEIFREEYYFNFFYFSTYTFLTIFILYFIILAFRSSRGANKYGPPNS